MPCFFISKSIARATMSRGASSARASCFGMKRVPSRQPSSWPPSPRTASVIRKDLRVRVVQAGRVELDELHVRHRGSPRAMPSRCRRPWRCRGWSCRGRPCPRRRWPGWCAARGRSRPRRVVDRRARTGPGSAAASGRSPSLRAVIRSTSDVLLEQRDVRRARAPCRSACAAPPRRWRRPHARCGAGCGRLRA